MKVHHINNPTGRIPLRVKKAVDEVSGQVIEIVSAPHEKGLFIEWANKLLKEDKISRDQFIKIVSGFFP